VTIVYMTKRRRRHGLVSGVVSSVLVGLLVIAGAGCARPADLTAADAADVAERLDRLSQRIGGTPAQRTAGEVLQYHAYQDPIRACMAQAGFTYTPPPFRDPYKARTVIEMGIGDGRWFAPLGQERLGVTDIAELTGPQEKHTPSASYRKLSAAEKEAYENTLTGCLPRDMADVNFPPAYYPLADAFNAMLSDAADDGSVDDAAKKYPSCMANSGIPVTSYNELIELTQARMGEAQPPPPGAVADAKWAAAAAFERQAARADATCRKPVYDLAIRAVAPAVDDFERDHHDDLAAIAEQWDDIVNRAAAHPESRK
jgi:hypothetical protein